MGIRARFTVVFVALSIVAITFFSGVIFYVLKHRAILAAEQSASEYAEHEWYHYLTNQADKYPARHPHVATSFIKIWQDGELVYDSFPESFANSSLQEGISKSAIIRKIQKLKGERRYEVLVFHDLRELHQYIDLLGRILLLGCLAACLLIIPISYGLTCVLLSPFSRLAVQTSKLNSKNLSFRFPANVPRDEYGMLVRNFNALLERLETAFGRLQLFAGQASHELRTPLCAIISQAEMFLRHQPDESAASIPVKRILLHAKRLSGIISQLLFLTEVEEGGAASPFQKVILEDLVKESVSFFSTDSEQIEIRSKLPEAHSIQTNPELLLTAINALVDNSIKHGQKNVLVSTISHADRLEIRIEDDGKGIPKNELKKVQEPFVRSTHLQDGSKNLGYGLGLTIARMCIRAVKGDLQLDSSELGGLRATIALPLRP